MTKPYLSVVIVGRNDDYGDDFLGRINTFVRSLDHQVREYPGVFELVVVEWNPLGDKQPLADALFPTQHLPVRVVTVPAELHDRLGASHPVLEFHGKNVGIRRARGEYVLVTNPDILFSQALVDELARKKLRLDRVYRTDRYDFVCEGIQDVDSEGLIDFAVRNTFVVHGMNGRSSRSEPVHESERSMDALPRTGVMPDGTYHTNGCGDFMLAAREVWYTVRGMYETLEHRWHVDSISLYRFGVAQVKQQLFTAPQCVFHQHHPRKDQDVSIGSLDVQGLAKKPGDTRWGFMGETLPETQKGPAQ